MPEATPNTQLAKYQYRYSALLSSPILYSCLLLNWRQQGTGAVSVNVAKQAGAELNKTQHLLQALPQRAQRELPMQRLNNLRDEAIIYSLSVTRFGRASSCGTSSSTRNST